MLLLDLIRLRQEVIKLQANQKPKKEEAASSCISSGFTGVKVDPVALIDSVIYDAAELIDDIVRALRNNYSE